MPSILHGPTSLITSDDLKKFIAKCKESAEENIKEFWENELKIEARKLFNLLPLKVYEESVFKHLQSISGEEVQRSNARKGSASFRKSISGSGSMGSIGNKFKTISLIETNTHATVSNGADFLLFIYSVFLELLVFTVEMFGNDRE